MDTHGEREYGSQSGECRRKHKNEHWGVHFHSEDGLFSRFRSWRIMVLELHIWGPAFGLPSFDAQSLATIAYLIQCVPATEWRLIASSDPSINPTSMILSDATRLKLNRIGELPALRVDSIWTSGFRSIVNYLREHSSGQWDLDRVLNEKQRADCTA